MHTDATPAEAPHAPMIKAVHGIASEPTVTVLPTTQDVPTAAHTAPPRAAHVA